jgi:hypothetical protein
MFILVISANSHDLPAKREAGNAAVHSGATALSFVRSVTDSEDLYPFSKVLSEWGIALSTGFLCAPEFPEGEYVG